MWPVPLKKPFMLPRFPHILNSASVLFLGWTWLLWASAPGDGGNPTVRCNLQCLDSLRTLRGSFCLPRLVRTLGSPRLANEAASLPYSFSIYSSSLSISCCKVIAILIPRKATFFKSGFMLVLPSVHVIIESIKMCLRRGKGNQPIRGSDMNKWER